MASTLNSDNGVVSGSAGLKSSADSSGVLALQTNGTTAVTVDTSQNVGVGVTPSAWGGNYKSIDYVSASVASENSVYGQALFINNAYNSSAANTPAWKYRNGNPAGSYVINANVHEWRIAPSGTAGNAITFTQAMTLDASGNLALGATSAASLGAGYTVFDNRGSTGAGQYFGNATNFGQMYANSTATYIGSATALPFVLQTGGTERARIDSSGNLLVGTTSAGAMITAKTQTAAGSALATLGTSGDTSFQSILVTKFDNNSTTSQNFIQFQINNGGANCGKITANGANTAAFGSTSDQRVKENIVDLPSQLANIMALRPVEYDYIESYGGGHQIGFIAQEVQQIYPDVISQDDSEENILSITGWSKTEARLVKAIQEQQAIITQLQADVAAMKA